jgi:hypothetical protein
MICNDGLSEFERDPDAGKKLAQGVTCAGRREDKSVAIGNHCNPVSILPSQHADVDQLVLVGGNTIRSVHSFYRAVGYGQDSLAEAVFAALADHLGYNVSKKAWRKRRDAQPTPEPSA